jgi:hypothetical protein
MEWKKIVFPAPKTFWTWNDYRGEIFWVPIPKTTMEHLKTILAESDSPHHAGPKIGNNKSGFFTGHHSPSGIPNIQSK